MNQRPNLSQLTEQKVGQLAPVSGGRGNEGGQSGDENNPQQRPVTFRGWLQQRIWRAFVVHQRAMTTIELAKFAYPRLCGAPIKRNHRYAIRRAAKAVAEPIGRRKGRGRPVLWRLKSEPLP